GRPDADVHAAGAADQRPGPGQLPLGQPVGADQPEHALGGGGPAQPEQAVQRRRPAHPGLQRHRTVLHRTALLHRRRADLVGDLFPPVQHDRRQHADGHAGAVRVGRLAVRGLRPAGKRLPGLLGVQHRHAAVVGRHRPEQVGLQRQLPRGGQFPRPDGGDSFSGHAYINTGTGFAPDPTFTGPAAEHYNFVRQALPQLTVSQGTPAGRATSGNSGGITGAYGGQLSVAYDQWSYTPQGTDPLRIADNIRFARELDLNPNPNLRVSDGAAAVS